MSLFMFMFFFLFFFINLIHNNSLLVSAPLTSRFHCLHKDQMVNLKICHTAQPWNMPEGKPRKAQMWIDLSNQHDERGMPDVLSAMPDFALQYCSFHCVLGEDQGFMVDMASAIKWGDAVITQVKTVFTWRYLQMSWTSLSLFFSYENKMSNAILVNWNIFFFITHSWSWIICISVFFHGPRMLWDEKQNGWL